MPGFARRHLTTIAVAFITAAITAGGPALAAAFDAMNADKVDGKHAVSPSVSIDTRKGKLVATSATTGLLPNDIIARAPNANLLDGVDSSKYRFISLDPWAAFVSGGATVTDGYGPFGGINVPDSGSASFAFGFTVPPDFRPGTTATLRLLWSSAGTSCTVNLRGSWVSAGRPGERHDVGASAESGLTRLDAMELGSLSRVVRQTRFQLDSPSGDDLRPGDHYGFSLYRDEGADSCTHAVVIHGASITY
jgi:hypothetical protein